MAFAWILFHMQIEILQLINMIYIYNSTWKEKSGEPTDTTLEMIVYNLP